RRGGAARREQERRERLKGPSGTAKKFSGSVKEQVARAAQLRAERDRRVAGVFLDVERSSVPPRGVIDYPKYWAQLSKMRKPIDAPKPTEREKALLRALNSTL